MLIVFIQTVTVQTQLKVNILSALGLPAYLHKGILFFLYDINGRSDLTEPKTIIAGSIYVNF